MSGNVSALGGATKIRNVCGKRTGTPKDSIPFFPPWQTGEGSESFKNHFSDIK